jgi:hypothetical protein
MGYGIKVSIFRKVINYHHDDSFFVGFQEVHYKIHGKVILDNGWDH